MLNNDELSTEALHYAKSRINKLNLKFESEYEKRAILFEFQNAYWLGATKMKTAIAEKTFLEKIEKENNDDDMWIFKYKMFNGKKKEVEKSINDFFAYASLNFDEFEVISMQQNYCGDNFDESLLFATSLIYKFR